MLWAVTAGVAGVVVLASYFVDLPVLTDLSTRFKQVAVLLVAASILVGLLNLVGIHLGKIGAQDKGWPYSALLVIMLVVTFALGLLFGVDNRAVVSLFRYVQVPVESTLFALLAVTLTAAGFRLLARRANPFNAMFALTAVLVLLGSGPWLFAQGLADVFSLLRTWLAEVWAVAGARGLLLGVALGTITAGLRVLLASDRPYGD